MRTRSMPSAGRPMAPGWPPAATTTPCRSGMPRRVRLCWYSPVTRTLFSPQPGRLMHTQSSLPARTVRRRYGRHRSPPFFTACLRMVLSAALGLAQQAQIAFVAAGRDDAGLDSGADGAALGIVFVQAIIIVALADERAKLDEGV